jgi:hypothetical protein
MMPQSPEDLAFAREDLQVGCQEGIYEEVSREEVEEIRSTWAMVSLSFCCVTRGCRGMQRPPRRQPLQASQILAERECRDGDLAGARARALA